MRPIQILTDSCSDLSGELLEKYNIDYCKMNTVYEGKETPASLTWEYYTPKALYDIMRAGNRVTTTQVPPQVFMDKFTEYLEKGMDIVYVACSGKLSGSVNTGSVIANELKGKYPDADIRCIDSLNACVGEGMMAIYAAQLRDQGLSAADIEAKVLDSRKLVNQIVTVDSLDTLKRAGRVKASAAFFGNLMGVRPILISDANGNNAPIKKVKGRANSMAEIVNELKETKSRPFTSSMRTVWKTLKNLNRWSKRHCPKSIPTSPISARSSVHPSVPAQWAYSRSVNA